MTSNISLCGADNDLSRSPWGLWDLEGAGQTRVPCRVVGGHRTEAVLLTSTGRSIHESAVPPVVEEEVGPVLVVAEDI